MFTGIVGETGRVVHSRKGKLTIACRETLHGMELGESVAVNGVCLTVTSFDSSSFTVDTMTETLSRSSLGLLSTGDKVNLEKAMRLGGSMGGHLVQGHIDDTGRVISVSKQPDSTLIKIQAPREVMRYVVEKGFVAVDGVSLTVTNIEDDSFGVSIVGFTREHTILNDVRAGQTVNLEVDIIAKYVEKLSKPGKTGITVEFLQEHGFLVK